MWAKITIVLFIAALILPIAPAQADSISLGEGATVPGRMHDSSGIKLEWQWLPVTMTPSGASGTQWYFALDAPFELEAFMGTRGAEADFDTSSPYYAGNGEWVFPTENNADTPLFTFGAFSTPWDPTLSYPWANSGHGIPTSIGAQGVFNVESVIFSTVENPGAYVTLVGELDFTSIMSSDFDSTHFTDPLPFVLVASVINNSQGAGESDFIDKYYGPSNNVNFIGSGGTPTDFPGVPEPGTMLLFGTCIAGMAWMRRRKSLQDKKG